MARYPFTAGKEYAARLSRVSERPIENRPGSGLRLLRLEFEVFIVDDSQQSLFSTGKIACRDLVVGPAVDVSRDASLTCYANALGIRNPSKGEQWLNVTPKSRWVRIRFGQVGEYDLRNSFQEISALNGDGWSVREYDYDLDKQWVTVGAAADDLECSEATIRRRLDKLAPIWGEDLVRRTSGNQRRIKLLLLRNLWKH